jgi:hypothetical protein
MLRPRKIDLRYEQPNPVKKQKTESPESGVTIAGKVNRAIDVMFKNLNKKEKDIAAKQIISYVQKFKI